HTYRGDLRVKLVSPSGKEVTLHDRTGGSADDLKFEVSRSEFANEPISGDWKLVVEDLAAQDEGVLKSWGLKIKKKDGGSTPTPPPSSGPTSIQVVGDAAFRRRVAEDLAKFAPGTTVDEQGYVHRATRQVAGHEQGYRLINELLNSPHKVTIQYVANNAYTQSGPGAVGTPQNPGAGSSATVAYDPNLNISLPTLQPDGTIRNEGIASEVVLAHELIHALHAQRGTIDRSMRDHYFTDGTTRYKETWRFEEFRTTGFEGFRQGDEPTENSIRAELGYRARATYLDRSGWTRVNNVSNIAEANRASAAASGQEQIVGDPWVPQLTESPNGQFIICNCFGCFGINNNDVQASSRL
ncbi:MAG: M91 family zinc metallopeptidase, partial [Blastocatellia bacterium]|nr:M91 family zinc metallopeptidase [Blastocatellia bacterium]